MSVENLGKDTAETDFEEPKLDSRAEVLTDDNVADEEKFRVRSFGEIESSNVQLLSDSLVDAVKNLNKVMVEKALVAEDGLRDYAKKLIEQGKNLSENCLNRFQPSDDNTCDTIVVEKYKSGAEETISKINEFIAANSDAISADNPTDVSGGVLEGGLDTGETLSSEAEIAKIDRGIFGLREKAVKASAETIMEIAKELKVLEQQKADLLQKIEAEKISSETVENTEDTERVEEVEKTDSVEEVVGESEQVESENSEVYNEENESVAGEEKENEEAVVEQKVEEVVEEVKEGKEAVLNETDNQSVAESVPVVETKMEIKDGSETVQETDDTRYVTGETLMNRGHRRELLKVKSEYTEMEKAYNDSLREFYMQSGVKSSLLGFKPPELSAELQEKKAELDNAKERYMRQMDTALEARSKRGLEGDRKYEGFNYRKEKYGDRAVPPELLRAFNTKFLINPYEKVAQIQQEALARTNEKKFKTLKAIIKPVTETMRKHKWAIRGLSIAGAALLGAATGGLAVGAAAAGTRAVRLGAGLVGGATAGAATMHLVDKAVDFNKNIASNKTAKDFSFSSFREMETELAQMKQKEFAIKRVGNAATLGAAFVAGMEVGDMADNLYNYGTFSRPEAISENSSSLALENKPNSNIETSEKIILTEEVMGIEMEKADNTEMSETTSGDTNSTTDSLTQETGLKPSTASDAFETSREVKERLFVSQMESLPKVVINSQMTPVQVMEILKANGGARIDLADGGANVNKMLGFDLSKVLSGGRVVTADGVNYSGYQIETIRDPISGLARGIKAVLVESQSGGTEAGGLNVPAEGKGGVPTQGAKGVNYEAARALVEQAKEIDTGIAADSKTPAEGLEKMASATAINETLSNTTAHTPETAEVVREYTVNKGDTIWGIIKSQYASELQGFSETEKRQLISDIEHKFKSDPELLESLNLKSGDLDKIYINEKINIAPLEAELKRQIELDGGVSSVKSVLDKTPSTKIMVEDMSDANSYITVVDNSRHADSMTGTKEVVFETSANPWETTSEVASTQETKSAVVEKLVKQENFQGNFDKLIPDNFRDQNTVGMTDQQFAEYFAKQGNYFFTPDNYAKVMEKFGSEEDFTRFAGALVEKLDKQNYGILDFNRFKNPMEVLGNVDHKFIEGLRGSESQIIKQFAENNQMKYEALVAWLDREKVLADNLPHKDGTTFNDLLYRGAMAELEEGKDYGLSAQAVNFERFVKGWRKGQLT